MRPVANFLLSIRHSVATRRMPSCSLLISRENTATLFPECLAASTPMFMAREDLPTPGRAARMMRSELFSPEMRRSRSMRPVDMPGNCPPWAWSSFTVFHTLPMTAEMWLMPWDLPWRMAYMRCSAASRIWSAVPLSDRTIPDSSSKVSPIRRSLALSATMAA